MRIFEGIRMVLRGAKAWWEMEKQQDGFSKIREDDTLSTAKEEKGHRSAHDRENRQEYL